MPFSREALQLHLKGRSPDRQPAHTLLGERPIACVDGRTRHAVAGTPGGNAGLFVLLITAIERFTKERLRAEPINDLLGDYLDRFGRFYMHSDSTAVETLDASLRKRHPDREKSGDLVDQITHPPKSVQSTLHGLVVHPEHIGCGHLRLLVSHPTAYGTRRGLTTTFIQHYFSRLWAGDDRLVFEVLEGHHAEEAVVCFHPDDSPAEATNEDHEAWTDDWHVPLQLPESEGRQMFVYHPEAEAYMYAKQARFARNAGYLSEDADLVTFIRLQRRIGERHLRLTLSHLAPDLPIYDVYTVEGELEVRER